jgi:3'-phosphoadenosine 5'-phosphosulfate sulfotransferase (PAPS reductase)/FAD synthetase
MIMSKKDIICWWSGGITSAVACKKAIEIFGEDRCRVIFMNTCNEDDDTYRFMDECAKWYGIDIEIITGLGEKYNSIQDVWRYHESLNVARGAICSTQLKRKVRQDWQKKNEYSHQVFGFEFNKKEMNRALALKDNHSETNPLFPLIMFSLTKDDCLKIVEDAGIKIPRAYEWGFHNNNCMKTGCVQGGVGYWQKMKRDFPGKFEAMAKMEHELTELRGFPITMLKDQSNDAKMAMKEDKHAHLVFLEPHPDYPNNKCLDDMPEMEVKPLMECSGFCGTNMYNGKNETKGQLSFLDE